MAPRPHKRPRGDPDAYCEYTIFSSEVANERTPPVLSIDTASSDLRRVYRNALLLDPSTGSGYSTPSHTPLEPPPGIEIGSITDWDPLLVNQAGIDTSAEREIFDKGELTNTATPVRYASSVSSTCSFYRSVLMRC